jgi:hypothetical protein
MFQDVSVQGRCMNAAHASGGHLRCRVPSRVPSVACILRISCDPRLSDRGEVRAKGMRNEEVQVRQRVLQGKGMREMKPAHWDQHPHGRVPRNVRLPPAR